MAKMKEILGRRYDVKLFEILAVGIAITALWAAGIYGATRFVQERDATSTRLAAEAQYAADFASFENARDENTRCIQRAEGRQATRLQARADVDFVVGIIYTINEINPVDSRVLTEIEQDARDEYAAIDERLPPLNPADCPPIPNPPVLPPSLTPVTTSTTTTSISTLPTGTTDG